MINQYAEIENDWTGTVYGYVPIETCCVSGAVSKNGISLIHGDSLQALKSYGDKQFDWAIIDPPYGIDVANDDRFGKKSSKKAATKTKDY